MKDVVDEMSENPNPYVWGAPLRKGKLQNEKNKSQGPCGAGLGMGMNEANGPSSQWWQGEVGVCSSGAGAPDPNSGVGYRIGSGPHKIVQGEPRGCERVHILG